MSTTYPPVETALYSRLAANSTLTTALGGTLIYNTHVPRTIDAPPYIVFYLIGGGLDNLTATHNMSETWAVESVGSTRAASATLADAVLAELHNSELVLAGWTNWQLFSGQKQYIVDVINRVSFHRRIIEFTIESVKD